MLKRRLVQGKRPSYRGLQVFGNRMEKLDEMFTATTFFSARSAKSSLSTLQSELENIAAES